MLEDLNSFSKKIQGKIKFNYSLKKHTWLNIGGNAKIFFVPETLIELKDFLLYLKKKKSKPFYNRGWLKFAYIRKYSKSYFY